MSEHSIRRGPDKGRTITAAEVPAKFRLRLQGLAEHFSTHECWEYGSPYHGAAYYDLEGVRHRTQASRLVVALKEGIILTGFVAMHSCDNPRCWNPAHLSSGTQKQNQADMAARGRAGQRITTPELRAAIGEWTRRSHQRNPGRTAHLRDRTRHPCIRPVITPTGRFPSAALAAEAHGIDKATAAYRARKGTKGWSYA